MKFKDSRYYDLILKSKKIIRRNQWNSYSNEFIHFPVSPKDILCSKFFNSYKSDEDLLKEYLKEIRIKKLKRICNKSKL